MHSDELKQLIEEIMQDTDDDKLKVECLKALVVNELNWGIFYLKEEVKEMNGILRTIKNNTTMMKDSMEGIKNRV